MVDPFPWAAGLEVPLVIAGNDASSGRWTDDSAPASGQVLGRIQVAEPGECPGRFPLQERPRRPGRRWVPVSVGVVSIGWLTY